MKNLFAVAMALALLACGLTGCGGTDTPNAPASGETMSSGEPASPQSEGAVPDTREPGEESSSGEGGSVLVAYFSATGNTEGIARHLQSILEADLYEIVPEVPYTSDDLNYSDDACRANQEQNDPDARPAISGTLEDPERYDVVFLGYPIWWGQAPKVLYTFLESCDFADAAIVPFCTSGSSGIGGSLEALQALAPDARWLDGQRFSGGTGRDEIARWVDGLGLDL